MGKAMYLQTPEEGIPIPIRLADAMWVHGTARTITHLSREYSI